MFGQLLSVTTARVNGLALKDNGFGYIRYRNDGHIINFIHKSFKIPTTIFQIFPIVNIHTYAFQSNLVCVLVKSLRNLIDSIWQVACCKLILYVPPKSLSSLPTKPSPIPVFKSRIFKSRALIDTDISSYLNII